MKKLSGAPAAAGVCVCVCVREKEKKNPFCLANTLLVSECKQTIN